MRRFTKEDVNCVLAFNNYSFYNYCVITTCSCVLSGEAKNRTENSDEG